VTDRQTDRQTDHATCVAVGHISVCRTGALRVGDRILAINGVALRGRNVEEAVRLLPTNDDSINIKVMRHLGPAAGLTCLCFCAVPYMPSVLCYCWLGIKVNIRPVKTE